MAQRNTPTGSETGGEMGLAGDSAHRMRIAIAAMVSGAGSQSQLETAARELVRDLKQADAPPERVLLQIKRVLADAGLKPTYGSDGDGDGVVGREAAVYRDVIAMGIRYYYRG